MVETEVEFIFVDSTALDSLRGITEIAARLFYRLSPKLDLFKACLFKAM